MAPDNVMHPPRRRFLQATALGAVALPTLLVGCTKAAEASASVAGSDVSGAWPASIMALEPMQPHVVPITEFGVRLEDCMVIARDGAHLFTPVSPSIEQPFG